MQNLKPQIYPHIGKISIVVGVMGIAAHLLAAFYKDLSFLSYLVVTHIQDYTYYFFKGFIDGPVRVSLATLLFLLMLSVGGYLYNKTEGRDARLLRFAYSIIFVKGMFHFLTLPFNYLHFQRLLSQNVPIRGEIPSLFTYVWPLLISIPVALIAYFITKWLIEDQQLQLNERTLPNGETKVTPKVTRHGKRFVHFLFDYALMFLIIGPVLIVFYNFLSSGAGFNFLKIFENRSLFTIMVLSGLIIYYLIFEGFFNSTPVKFLTGTTVVREQNLEKPGFGKILGRTFSRRIPFEPFSFFGSKGWHDSITETLVVEEDTFGKSRSYHGVWAFLFIGIYLGAFAFNFIDRIMDQSRRDNFATNSSMSMMKATIDNLNEGDIIDLNKLASNYKAQKTLIKIIESGEDELIAQRYNYPNNLRLYKGNADPVYNSAIRLQDTVTTSRSELFTTYDRRNRSPLEFTESQYYIGEIFDMDHPEMKTGGSSWRYNDGDPFRSFTVTYDQVAVEVVGIENLKGRVKWDVEFPIESNFDSMNNKGTFTLKAKKVSKRRTYKAEMTLRYNGKEHLYIIEGLDSRVKIYRESEQ